MDREITLLAAARKMDGNALTEIFERYAPALYRYAFRFCNNATVTDQIVGEIFERFIEQVTASRIPGINLRSSLYEMAYRILVNDLRYMNFLGSSEAFFLRHEHQWPTVLGGEDKKFFETIQRSLMYDLTDDQRHVVILRFIEGFSLKETAVIMGKKVGNVKVIQNRAIVALRKTLDYQAVETHTITLFIRRMAQA